ncbi:MAG: response regulator, partial [Desulfobacterales bacterium]|nr:response regulator [Desulfobacterales bacterium]
AKSADSLLTLVNDLFDFSKADAGKMTLEIIDFNIRTTLDGAADVILLKAFEKDLSFEPLIDPDVPSLLRGDPGRLRQALMKYANNAVKYTDKGKVTIRVSLEWEEEDSVQLRFMVADTGIGIPKNRANDIFDASPLTDASAAREGEGAGLGLAVTRQIVALMGGEVGVESREGEGSTFWFTAIFEKQARVRQMEIAPLADPRGKRILVVDDHASDRRFIGDVLRSFSSRPAEASDGRRALEKLRQAQEQGDPFEVAILDMTTPGLNGEELGRAIKKDPGLSGVILIMLTAYGRRGDAARLKKIGFAGYLVKPVLHGEIYECLIMVLSRAGKGKEAALVTRHTLAENRKAGARILLVEDNRTNRIVAKGILEKLGCKVEMAVNGREAVNAWKTSKCDLVLMDCQMPVLDGCSATREIRELEKRDAPPDAPRPGIPVIAMTANTMEDNRQECLDSGMNDFLTKPIDPKKLTNTIIKWLTAPVAAPQGASRADESGEERKERADDQGRIPVVEEAPVESPDGKEAPEESPDEDAAPAIFDHEGLLYRLMDDEALAREVVEEFLTFTSDYVKVLEEALEKRD